MMSQCLLCIVPSSLCLEHNELSYYLMVNMKIEDI